jgi:hypothetical protein
VKHARIFIKNLMSEGHGLALVEWETLKRKLIERFNNADPEALIRQWKTLTCAHTDNGHATEIEIEEYWDNFNNLLQQITSKLAEFYHPSKGEIQRQLLRGLADWKEQLSLWFVKNPDHTLRGAVDEAKMYVRARAMLSQVTTLCSQEDGEESSDSPPSLETSDDDPNLSICYRCGAQPPPNTSCQCLLQPKCGRCGGLHQSHYHDQARSAYLHKCKAYNWVPHACYDKSLAQNEGWWERQTRARKRRRGKRQRV